MEQEVQNTVETETTATEKVENNSAEVVKTFTQEEVNGIVKERDTIKFRIVKKSPKFLFNRRLIRKKRIINKRFRDI